MKMKIFRFSLFLFAMTTMTLTAYAGPVWLPNGLDSTQDEIKNMENPDIQVNSAYVVARPNFADHVTSFDATVMMENTADHPVDVMMGFWQFCTYDQCDTNNGPFNLKDFRVKDDNYLNVSFSPAAWSDDTGAGWQYWEVNFQPGEVKNLNISYHVRDYIDWSDGAVFAYPFEGMMNWKGDVADMHMHIGFSGEDDFYSMKKPENTFYDDLAIENMAFDVAKLTADIAIGEVTEQWHIDWNPSFSFFVPYQSSKVIMEGPSCSPEGYEEGVWGGYSSYLPGEGSLSYLPCYIDDGDADTAWVEGVDGPGVGEYMTTYLRSDIDYYYFKILNGYHGDGKTVWQQNNRVKKLRMIFSSFDDGVEDKVMELDLPDSYDEQKIQLPEVVSGYWQLRLEILDTYPGTKYDDTAISEIQFYGLPSGYEVRDSEVKFSDIAYYIYEDAINFVKDQGVVKGYEDGTYRPDDYINRAEFAKIVMEARYPGESAGADCFSDVAGDWYAKYVCYAKEKGVINGHPDGSFKPGDRVNYAEALKIILEAYGHDGWESDPWYQTYVDIAADMNGGIAGLDPGDYLTRGEMAQLIYKLGFEM